MNFKDKIILRLKVASVNLCLRRIVYFCNFKVAEPVSITCNVCFNRIFRNNVSGRTHCGFSALLNMVVPSGGSQFMVEAPYIMPAAKELGISTSYVVNAFTYNKPDTAVLGTACAYRVRLQVQKDISVLRYRLCNRLYHNDPVFLFLDALIIKILKLSSKESLLKA